MRLPFVAIALTATLALTAAALRAADLTPLMTVPGPLILSEDFSGTVLPVKWQPGGRPGSFTLVEGALQGVCAAEDSHGPSIGVPLAGRNLTVQFAMKYLKPGNFLFLLDGESQFGGAAHLLRVGLAPNLVVVQQDRGSPASKLAQKQEKDAVAKAGGKALVPTKEQLTDPRFYRIERLGAQTRKVADDRWHNVLVEVSGNQVVVQVDDGPPILATGTVLDMKKSRIVFLVGGAGTALIDNVKVWENSPRADWSEVKARLPATTEKK